MLDRWMTAGNVDGDFTACDTAMLNRFLPPDGQGTGAGIEGGHVTPVPVACQPDRGSNFTVSVKRGFISSCHRLSDGVSHAALGVQGALVRYVIGVAVYHLAGLPAVEAHQIAF
jgi:hypothetical protein